MVCDCMREYLREQGKALVVEEEGESCKNPITSIQVRTCLAKAFHLNGYTKEFCVLRQGK